MVEIRLKLKVGDVELELSENDARWLWEALERLVGTKRIEYFPWQPIVPYWPFETPWTYRYTSTTGDVTMYVEDRSQER